MAGNLKAAKEGMKKIRAARASRVKLNKELKGKSASEQAKILNKLQQRPPRKK